MKVPLKSAEEPSSAPVAPDERPPLPAGGGCMPTCPCACNRNCGCREGGPVPTPKRPRSAGRKVPQSRE